MPLYEYVCKKCGKRSERIEKMDGPRMKKCPKCGGSVEQVLSAPAIQFKGSGWYVTDYAGKSGKTEPVKTDSAESAKAETKRKEGNEIGEWRVREGRGEEYGEEGQEFREREVNRACDP